MWQLGAAHLSTAELLAILLGSGGVGHSAIALGYEIVRRGRGSLRALAARPIAELTAIPGVGPARAAVVHAALELAKRCADERASPRRPMRSPLDVVAHAGAAVGGSLGGGTARGGAGFPAQDGARRGGHPAGLLNSSPVHAREVFREAIAEAAAAIVLVHNHPSGDPTPSADDVRVTAEMVAAGRVVDIPVFDHVIIGRGCHVSLAEQRLL